MTYREYTRGKKQKFYRSRGRGQKPIRIAALPARSSEHQRLVSELKVRVGLEGFYNFSRALPDHVVLNEKKFSAAIRAEIWRLDNEAEMADKEHLADQNHLFACKQFSTAEGEDAKLP